MSPMKLSEAVEALERVLELARGEFAGTHHLKEVEAGEAALVALVEAATGLSATEAVHEAVRAFVAQNSSGKTP